MLRRQNRQIPNQTKRKWATCLSLLLRIRNQRFRDARNTYLKHIRNSCLFLLFCFVVLMIFQCPNRMYNTWKGPFSMNLNEFRNHLETSYNPIGYYISSFSFHSFLFQAEYIQIELGQNAIDQSTKNTFRVFYGHYSDGHLLYTFNRVREPTIDTSEMTLYVKFASHEQSHSQRRYSYYFQSFSIKTLRCIVEQLTISPKEFMNWPEKSIYIEKIEQIYDQNPIVFNKKVIRKCGILIGYLYRPTNEYVFPGDSYEYHQFSKHVRAFDASSSYTPYMSYILIGLFIFFLLVFVEQLVENTIYLINQQSLIVHSSIQEQMKELNINSLENLDSHLLNATYENNHYDRLFIVYEKYLIILMIDLHENNERILRRFYENAPLTIIPIDMISHVRQNYIMLGNSRWIDLPINPYIIDHFDPSNWLHQRLMLLNDQYRYTWEREEQLRYQEEIRHAQEEEHRRQLAVLTEEEAQYLLRQYENDINRVLQRITSASPRFIAQFRLSDRQIVTDNLLDTTCRICLDNFQLDQYFAQWPCTAKHAFHFDCMLDVLRAGNTCPLCRHPIEAAELPNTETALRLILGRMMPNIFN